MSHALTILKGRQLSAVTFVQDYIQLHFDGPYLNLITSPTIEIAGDIISNESCDFRNQLCSLIAKKVTAAGVREHEELSIKFGEQSRITVSLRDEDYETAEAVVFVHDGETWIW